VVSAQTQLGPRKVPAAVDTGSIQCGVGRQAVAVDRTCDGAARSTAAGAMEARERARSVGKTQRTTRSAAGGGFQACDRDDLRADVKALLEAAVGSLFTRHNCCELFHCVPEQIVDAQPDQVGRPIWPIRNGPSDGPFWPPRRWRGVRGKLRRRVSPESGDVCSICLALTTRVHFVQVLQDRRFRKPSLLMPFYCSYRNKNKPSAIYPSFGYSPPPERK
jgi:hypothetical protein